MHAIMVHGAGGGGWQWAIWAGVFSAEGWSVLASDLRPAGSGPETTGLFDYLAQVRAWRDQVAGQRQVLIGASLGGLLALAAAAESPPAALVLVNPVPPRGVQPWPAFASRPAKVAWSALPFVATRKAMPDAELAGARWAHARWRDESGRALNEAAAGVDVAMPACPTLVMASATDIDIPAATSRAAAARLGADFVEVRDCGHLGVLLGHAAARSAAQAAAWLRVAGGNSD